MDLDGPEQMGYGIPSRTSQKGPRLSRNDEKWESLRQEIRRLYMAESRTLPGTMSAIEEKHGFKASVRKWKEKLKEWGYEKHLSEAEMKIIVAKAEKRMREDGKDTVFIHNGFIMTSEKIANFKRRKTVRVSDPASPGAETPAGVTYSTPGPANDIPTMIYLEETSEQIRSIEIPMMTASEVIDDSRTNPSQFQDNQQLSRTITSEVIDLTTGPSQFRGGQHLSPTTTSECIDLTTSPDPFQHVQTLPRTGYMVGATKAIAPTDPAVSKLIYFSHLVFTPLDRLDLFGKRDSHLDHPLLPQNWEIAKAFPEDIILWALSYQRRHKYLEAVNTLVHYISPCLRRDNNTSIVLDTTENFFEPSQHATSHRDAVVYARRMLADKCRWLFGDSAQATLEAQEFLAECLNGPDQIEEAVSLYLKTSEEYRNLRMKGFLWAQWRCLSAIACIFLRTNRHELAASLIIRNIFTEHLRHIMDPVTNVRRCLEKFVDVVETLNASYLFSKDEKRGWGTISTNYMKMLDLVRSNLDWNLGMFPEILYRALELAKAYSAIREFDNAEPLFSLALERLDSFGCFECCVPHVYASAYLWYGEHLLRNQKTSEAARYLMTARDVLLKNDLSWIAFDERIRDPWFRAMLRLKEQTKEEDRICLNQMLEMDNQATPRKLRLERIARKCPDHSSQPEEQNIGSIYAFAYLLLCMDNETAKVNKNYNFTVWYPQSPRRNVKTGVDLREFELHRSTLGKFGFVEESDE